MLQSWVTKLSVTAVVEPIRANVIGRIRIDLVVQLMIVI